MVYIFFKSLWILSRVISLSKYDTTCIDQLYVITHFLVRIYFYESWKLNLKRSFVLYIRFSAVASKWCQWKRSFGLIIKLHKKWNITQSMIEKLFLTNDMHNSEPRTITHNTWRLCRINERSKPEFSRYTYDYHKKYKGTIQQPVFMYSSHAELCFYE